jgi:hypothetical protein
MMRLKTIAFARSGDKGANANIGVGALTEDGYSLIQKKLTPKRVMAYFKDLHPRNVIRYELPNLLAMNFILEGILEGGGNRSLRTDAQGKALAQALLEIDLDEKES